MKKIITQIIVMFAVSSCFCQTQNTDIVAEIANTGIGQVEVTFNPTSDLSGTALPLVIYLKMDQTEATGATISLVSNPYSLSFITSFNDAGNTFFQYESSSTIDLTTWTNGSTQSVGEFSVSGPNVSLTAPESIITLSGGEYGVFPNGSGGYTWVGTSLTINNTETNLVTWPVVSQASLPITLETFNAAPSEKDANLTWTTSSEINGSHFEIERSANGRDFAYVASVEAAGESSRELDYDYKDINAASIASPEGNLYYRLRMVDRDGSYEYSDTRIVQFKKGTSSFRIFPNPTAQQVTVALQGYEINDQTQLAIFDVTGKMIVSKGVQSTNQILDLKSMGLLSGVYQVMLMQDGIIADQLSIAIVD